MTVLRVGWGLHFVAVRARDLAVIGRLDVRQSVIWDVVHADRFDQGGYLCAAGTSTATEFGRSPVGIAI